LNVTGPAGVVVASCRRDLPVNAISIPALMRHVSASNYFIVVPSADLPAFRAALPGEVSLMAEESLITDWPLDRIAKALAPDFADRAGWYLQQFIKIEAVRRLAANAEALIWDGDTVPLRQLDFKDPQDRIGFYVSRERYQPYFDTARRVAGLERAIPQSFIAQCMYLRARWVQALLDRIEQTTGREWIEAILSALPGRCPSEFSEYETIGTFAMSEFRDGTFVNHRPWFRWGMAHFGGIQSVTPAGLERLARSYDFVALESWDRGARAWLRGRVQRLADRVAR